MTDLTLGARAVLRANDRGGYTVPTAACAALPATSLW